MLRPEFFRNVCCRHPAIVTSEVSKFGNPGNVLQNHIIHAQTVPLLVLRSNVAKNQHRAGNLAGCIINWRRTIGDVTPHTVLGGQDDLFLVIPGLPGMQYAKNRRLHRLSGYPVGGGKDIRKHHTNRFLAGITSHGLGSRIHKGEVRFVINGNNTVIDRTKCLIETVGQLPNPLFFFIQLGDVIENPH